MSAVGFDMGVDPRVAERRVVRSHFYPVERFAADNSSAFADGGQFWVDIRFVCIAASQNSSMRPVSQIHLIRIGLPRSCRWRPHPTRQQPSLHPNCLTVVMNVHDIL